MKFNSIRACVGVALAMTAGASFAAPITYPGADPDAMIVNASGATATDIVMADAFINNSTSSICDPAAADIDVYTSEATFLPTVANYAIACHTRTTVTPAPAANIDVIFRKYSGGSGSGIAQVASGAPLANDVTNNRQWVDVLACHGAVTPVAVAATASRAAYNLYAGCTTTGSAKITNGGLSDVEPALLGATTTQLGQLSINGAVAVDFAPIVSVPLYTALQAAQHLTACNATTQNPECIPNLSSAQIRGIFMGKTTSTAFLFSNPVGDTGTASAIPASGGTNSIFLCRRGNSSGTQTSYQVHFLRQGCGTAGVGSPSVAFVGATTATCTAAGCGWNSGTFGGNLERVFAGTGAADVVACVNFRSTQTQYAIGTLSTEVLSDDNANAAFRHIKVDGVLPSLENVKSGAYEFFTEDTLNTPGPSSPQVTGAGGVPVMSSQQANVLPALLNALRSVGSLKAGLVNHPWGYGGVLGIPSTFTSTGVPVGTLSQHADILAAPINSSTRSAAYGSGPNNCNPAWNGARTLTPIDTNAY